MSHPKPSVPLSALVVDDEPPARRELTSMLEVRQSVRVVGEAGSVDRAARLAGETNPAVVFLDIRLRGESGFDLLDRLPEGCRVVFVTAYEVHAVRAFEVNAMDYLLKPVTDRRLDEALARIVDDRGDGDEKHSIPPLDSDDHLFLSLDGDWGFVRVDDIRCVRASGDYTRVVTRSGQETLVSRTMKAWDARLPSKTFLRIHRSTIVNMDEVTRVEERSDGACLVHLRGEEDSVRMSRRYAARIRDRMS